MRRRLIRLTAALWVAASAIAVSGTLYATIVNEDPSYVLVGLALALSGLLVARWLWTSIGFSLPAAFYVSLIWLPVGVAFGLQAPGGQLLPLQLGLATIATSASLLALLLWVTRPMRANR
jgi:hypothetical protein